MSNIKYNEAKVNEFKTAYQEYLKAKVSFKKEMKEFQSTMDFMKGNQDANLASSTSETGYVINDSGILMKVADSTATTIYDNSINNVVDVGGKKAFVSNVEFKGDPSTIGETNKLYQIGLDDLTYDQSSENVVSDDNKYVTTDKTPTITINNDCNLNNLSQCSARAKMTNKPYYGIEGGTDSTNESICNCYVFDDQPTNLVPEKVETVLVDTGDSDDTAYLATMMDGSFYKIKKNTYSSNYSAFYEYNSTTNTNLHKIIDGGLSDATVGLSPFVGNGINSITISELGKSNCATK